MSVAEEIGKRTPRLHIKRLEEELKRSPSPELREHIQRLKKAWGIESPDLVAA